MDACSLGNQGIGTCSRRKWGRLRLSEYRSAPLPVLKDSEDVAAASPSPQCHEHSRTNTATSGQTLTTKTIPSGSAYMCATERPASLKRECPISRVGWFGAELIRLARPHRPGLDQRHVTVGGTSTEDRGVAAALDQFVQNLPLRRSLVGLLHGANLGQPALIVSAVRRDVTLSGRVSGVVEIWRRRNLRVT